MERYYEGYLVLTDRFVPEYIEESNPLKVIDKTKIIFRTEDDPFYRLAREIYTGVKIPIITLLRVENETQVIQTIKKMQSVFDFYADGFLKNNIRCFTLKSIVDRYRSFIEDAPQGCSEINDLDKISDYLKQYPDKKLRRQVLKSLLEHNRLVFSKNKEDELTNYEMRQAKIKEYIRKHK